MKKVELTASGFKFKGNWEELCNFGGFIEKIIKYIVMSKKSLKEFNKWRPRLYEDENEMVEKSADMATMSELLNKINNGYAKRVVSSLIIMEKNIYKLMMWKNPCYFDTKEFSVSLDINNHANIMSVNFKDDKVRKKVVYILKEY